jgi:hypothetical protein
MNRFESIAPYTRPLDDPEREFLIRQALASAALAQAKRESSGKAVTDGQVEEVLARVTPHVLEQVTSASSSSAIGRAALAAVRGDLLPPRREYTDAELEL